MIKKNFISLILSVLITFGFAQTKENNAQVAKVENGLLANAEVIFEDSVVPKFNINDRMKFYKVPSVSIAVINNGKFEWAKAYGYADLNDKTIANENTVYQAASVSKSVNAFFIMKLVEDGKLSLNKDIRQYLKTWTLPENEFSKNKTITLKNLLSHSAGLSTSGFIGYSKNDTIPTINEILDGKKPANSEAVKPVLSPGTKLKYSGGGITLIRKILDDNISSNYDSLLQKVILIPLKMNNSSFSQPLNSSRKNYATAYDGQMQEVKGKYNIYPEQAPDGLWTTATDLAKFIISIQQSINNNSGSFLKNSTVKEMLAPFPDSSEAALGFFIKEKNGEKYFTHSGANIGFRSDYYGSFSSGNGVVILTNSDNGQDLINEIINSVATVYNWKGFYNPVLKKLVAVPDTLLNKYAGEYFSENPSLKIIIENKNGELELTARRPERMYATGKNTFFLLSSPSQDVVFTSSKNDGAFDKFEVKQGDDILIKAIKK
jgi:CubicO group peptidase (beta-lactamase class C family)